ncbi:MAG: hypothetical protein ABI988_16885, partial [Nitrospirota bacterium]
MKKEGAEGKWRILAHILTIGMTSIEWPQSINSWALSVKIDLWRTLKARSVAISVMAEHEARLRRRYQPNIEGRVEGKWGDDCQNTVAELPSVILRR